MKRLIYQVYVGKPSRLYDHCTKSVKEYADRIGADYVCQTSPILMIRPNPFTSNRSKEAVDRLGYLPIYEKENAFDYLDRYDQIAIIDSDIYIRPNAPDIFPELPPESPFGAVVERTMPITGEYAKKIYNYSHMQYGSIKNIDFGHSNLAGYEFMNMGMIVINRGLQKYLGGQTAKQFLSRPEFQPFVDGVGAWKWSTDQTLLNVWIRHEQMPFKRLHWKWNGLFGANIRIQECHFVHFFLKDKLPEKGENVEELMKQI